MSTTLAFPLTLVSAPAGFGKTTTLSEWSLFAADRGLQLAWLSLDANDNDPALFITYLLTALRQLDPHLGETTLGLLHASQSAAPAAIFNSLINDLNELAAEVTLILDDYHFITNHLVHDVLAFVLEHLPSQLRLILITRADPPLPLARLRARNQLVEIRSADLRFTSDEAGDFLNSVMELDLATDEIAALQARTEGWAAGLQLAALSMQNREDVGEFITAFTGSHQYIVDYLAEEVVHRQPETVQTFLLQTSILEHMSGALCNALTDRPDGQAMLEALAQANLFVISLDDERHWYRYHHLFRDVLRDRLRHETPDRCPHLHRRAADWYEAQGFAADAIHHALLAGDAAYVAQLVEQYALSMLERGDLTTLLKWIDAVRDQVQERPWLSIYQAWALTLTAQLDQVDSLLQQAELLIQTELLPADTPHILGHIRAIQGYVAAMRGDPTAAVHQAQEALSLLPQQNRSTRSAVSMTLGVALRISGDLQGARHALDEAARAGQAAGNVYLALGALSSLADLLYDQGCLRQSCETYQEGLRLATYPSGRRMPAAGMMFFGQSLVFYEWNDLEAANRNLAHALELCQKWGNITILMAGHVMLFRVKQALGDEAGALGALTEAERLARDYPEVPRAPSWVTAHRVRLWLSQSNTEAAARWVQQCGLSVDDTISYWREAEYLALGRVLLAQGKGQAALRLWSRMLSLTNASGRLGSEVELQVLQALTHQALGNMADALVALERAFVRGQPERYTRTFLDEGEPMKLLLRHAVSHGIAPQYAASLLSQFDVTPGDDGAAPQPLIEPLSDRELEVLRLIAEGCSNQEIANQLVIAVGTVKAHTTNIYGKLGVNSRTQASARAKTLHLI